MNELWLYDNVPVTRDLLSSLYHGPVSILSTLDLSPRHVKKKAVRKIPCETWRVQGCILGSWNRIWYKVRLGAGTFFPSQLSDIRAG